MKKKIKITKRQYAAISKAYRYGGFLSILGLLIGFSILIGKPIEFLFLFFPYFATKGLYARQFHSRSLKECFILSLIIFALALMACMPHTFSIAFSFLFGLIIAFGSYKAGAIQIKLKDYGRITAPTPFNVDTCTEDELIDRCKELHLSFENTELAIEFFIKKTKQSIIADKLCIDEKSVTTRKKRLKEKLNKI